MQLRNLEELGRVRHSDWTGSRNMLLLQLLLGALTLADVAAAAERQKPPGQAFNLSGWELQTCLQSPRAVSGASLSTHTDRNFFLSEDGAAIVMLTPDNASAITVHADHPRTEFRETGVADWAWGGRAEHVLSLRTTVLHVSNTNQETIVAQIHGSADEEIAKVLKLRWTRGLLEARVKNRTAPYGEIGLDCGEYQLGEPLQVEVRVSAGLLRVSVNGKAVAYTPPFNSSDRFYFKAGDYNQCAPCGHAGQYAEVHLAHLATTHRPAVAHASASTNSPA